ncbi:MAG: hypothetical protein IPL30_10995 [Elusimicrobia bacterium]|nr:hypothetical protein [Elusimicrobiota bacterium]
MSRLQKEEMMEIYGYEVSNRQICAGVGAMRGEFHARAVQKALEKAGVPEVINRPFPELLSMRVADALLRREKRRGNIIFSGGLWRK